MPVLHLPGFGAVAQLGEHLLCKQGVRGSIPLRSTRRPGVTRDPHIDKG